MKRLLFNFPLLFFLFALVAIPAACGNTGGSADASGNTPGQAVEKALSLYKAQDYAGFNSVLTTTYKDFSPETSDFDASTLKAFSQIEYTVKSEKVSGASAIVTAGITAIDIKTAVSETVTHSINMQLSGEWDTEDEERLQQQYMDYYNSYVLDPARAKITAEVKIGLQKVNGIWKIEPDASFANALTGFRSGAGSVDVEYEKSNDKQK